MRGLILLSALGISGCALAPCDGIENCVELHVEGDLLVDQLEITETHGSFSYGTRTAPAEGRREARLPQVVAIGFSAALAMGPRQLAVVARHEGVVVGRGSTEVVTTGGTVVASVSVVGVAGPDGGTDLSGLPPVLDLAGPDLATPDPCSLIPDLVAYFSFDGTMNDAVSGTSAVTTNLAATSGVRGGAYSFDVGSLVPAASRILAGARTYCAWVKPRSASGVGNPIFSFGMLATPTEALVIDGPTAGGCAASAGTLAFASQGSCGTSAPLLVPVGAWSFVCLASPGVNETTLSVNGVSVAGMSFASTYQTTYTTVGAYGSGPYADQHFQGDIDEVSIWERKLTPGEIATLYNFGGACAIR